MRAPVRTKPERTYNPIGDSAKPEGGHIPMVLREILFYQAEMGRFIARAQEVWRGVRSV